MIGSESLLLFLLFCVCMFVCACVLGEKMRESGWTSKVCCCYCLPASGLFWRLLCSFFGIFRRSSQIFLDPSPTTRLWLQCLRPLILCWHIFCSVIWKLMSSFFLFYVRTSNYQSHLNRRSLRRFQGRFLLLQVCLTPKKGVVAVVVITGEEIFAVGNLLRLHIQQKMG